jgi:hypothetical protein
VGILIDVVRRVVTKKAVQPDHPVNRDYPLGDAIVDIGLKSAWGKWHTAQNIDNLTKAKSPLDLQTYWTKTIEVAASIVADAAMKGQITIRGRPPTRIDYEIIPSSAWRLVGLAVIHDIASIWKTIIIPKGVVTSFSQGRLITVPNSRVSPLLAYDSLIVDQGVIESRWPLKDRSIDRKRRRLLNAALRNGASPEVVRAFQEHRSWRRAIALAGMLAFGVGIAGTVVIYFWSTSSKGPVIPAVSSPSATLPNKAPWKHTLEQLYELDFPDLLNGEEKLSVTVANSEIGLKETTISLRFRVHEDFRSGTYFISMFIPSSNNTVIDEGTYGIIEKLRDAVVTEADKFRKGIVAGMSQPGTPYTDSTQMKFSGRVFIYTLQPFSVIQLGELTSWYLTSGIALQIRGMEYWQVNKDR